MYKFKNGETDNWDPLAKGVAKGDWLKKLQDKLETDFKTELPLKIGFLEKDVSESFNPTTGLMETKFPRGRAVHLIGSHPNQGEVICYEHRTPNKLSPGLSEYSPSIKQFYKTNVMETVALIDDVVLAYFLCYFSTTVEGNKCQDKSTPTVRIINEREEAKASIKIQRKSAKINSLILVDGDSNKDEQQMLVNIARSLGIPNVSGIIDAKGIEGLSQTVVNQIGSLEVAKGINYQSQIDKVDKFHNMFVNESDNLLAKSAIRQAIDQGKMSLAKEGGVHKWFLNDADGNKVKEIMGQIPGTHDPYQGLINEIEKRMAIKSDIDKAWVAEINAVMEYPAE